MISLLFLSSEMNPALAQLFSLCSANDHNQTENVFD